MTNLMNVMDYLRREAERIYTRVDRLERERRATAKYLDRLEEAAEHLEEAASHINAYFEIRRSLKARVLDTPPVPGRRPRVFRQEILVISGHEPEEVETGAR